MALYQRRLRSKLVGSDANPYHHTTIVGHMRSDSDSAASATAAVRRRAWPRCSLSHAAARPTRGPIRQAPGEPEPVVFHQVRVNPTGDVPGRAAVATATSHTATVSMQRKGLRRHSLGQLCRAHWLKAPAGRPSALMWRVTIRERTL